MRLPTTISIELTEKQLIFVTRQIREGKFATENELFDFAVAALEEEETARKRWEREVLIPAHDELMANPSTATPIDQVEATLEARRRRRLQAS